MARNLSRRRVLAGAAAAALAGRSSAQTTTHEIVIKRFTYDPAVIQVRVGDVIRWTNKDIAPHTASADDLSWDTGEVLRDDSAEVTVTEGMELTYFCVFHPHMKGTIQIL